MRFLQGALVIWVLLHTSQFRSPGKCYAFPTPLLVEVLDEAAGASCVQTLLLQRKLVNPPKCQRTPTFLEGSHASGLPVPHCCLVFLLWFRYCLKSSQVLMTFTPTSCPRWPGSKIIPHCGPAIQMLKPYFLHWGWKTQLTNWEQRWARGFLGCMVSSCLFLQDVVFTTCQLEKIPVIFAELFTRTDLESIFDMLHRHE